MSEHFPYCFATAIPNLLPVPNSLSVVVVVVVVVREGPLDAWMRHVTRGLVGSVDLAQALARFSECRYCFFSI